MPRNGRCNSAAHSFASNTPPLHPGVFARSSPPLLLPDPPMSSTFFDYFRCPEDVADLSTDREVSQDEGFFTFDGSVCYGRATGVCPSKSVGAAPAVTESVSLGAGGPGLPFDVSEVTTNLRYERYFQGLNGFSSSAVARNAYYSLRPILPVPVRRHLQKMRLAGWNSIPFPEWPVDVSVDRLMRSISAQIIRSRGGRPMPFIWFWPDGAPSCATMTHDVEAEAGRDFCSTLMDLDGEFGIRSSFQVVPESRYKDSLGVVENIRARGFEVNVHDLNHDGRLFRDRQEFLKRAKRINSYARQFHSRGFRSGAMYREQAWYDAFEFSYDMSVPNVAHLEPQRGGCCTVMPYFVGRILELPLTTTQDYSLFHILGDYSTALWTEQMNRISAENGLISFITHPDYLIEGRARRVYRELLTRLVREREAGQLWVAPPAEIDRWWRDRREMVLVPAGDSWRIEGPSSDRARVAYAASEAGKCVYTFDTPPVANAVPSTTAMQGGAG